MQRLDRIAANRAGARLESTIVLPLAFGLGGIFILLRPAVSGEIASLQLAATLLAGGIAGLVLRARQLDIARSSAANIQLSLLAFLWLYMAWQGARAGGIFTDIATKALLINGAAMMTLCLIVWDRKLTRPFFDAISVVVILSSISICVTVALIAVGFTPSSIQVAYIPYTYTGRGIVLFPFTFSFNPVITWFGVIPRLSGIFREPGIVPAFACWAAVYSFERRWPRIVVAVCLLASILSFSTLGPLAAAYTAGFLVLRIAGVPMLTAAALVAFLALALAPTLYALEYVGLREKMTSQTGSFEERMYALQSALSANNLILGDGLQAGYTRTAAINLIGQIRLTGLVPLLLLSGIYGIACYTRLGIMGLAPLIGTVLFAQPIAFEPPVAALFFSWLPFATDAKSLAIR